MALESYDVRVISYSMAMDVVIRHHYLHRKAPCSFAFGLFMGSQLMGVVCYGTPSSSPLRSGIAGHNNRFNVIELTRLWVNDDVPKNGESFLIGNTLRKVNKEIIVSYAESDRGHIGIVYQATNFLYTGLSAKRTDWTVKGINSHSQTIADKYTIAQVKEKYGDDFSLVDRPRKHRYIFFNCKPIRKRMLLLELKYPILPYPKKGIINHDPLPCSADEPA